MEVLAQGTAQHSANAVSYLEKHPQAVQQLGRYKTVLRDLKRASQHLAAVLSGSACQPAGSREPWPDANDSLIVAAMRRERITYLATNDSDFARVPDIAVRFPQ